MKHYYLPTLCLSLMALVVPSFAHQAPSHHELEQSIADGTLEEKIAYVERYGNHKMSPDLIQKAKNKVALAKLKAQGASENDLKAAAANFTLPDEFEAVASTGSPAVLTIVIDFADTRLSSRFPSISVADINDNIYGVGTSEAQSFAPFESVFSYYNRASEGALTLAGNTLGVYSFSETQAQLTPANESDENQAIFDMVVEALNSFDATHDFSQYDNDGDGDIDGLNIIWSGVPSNSFASFWWRGYQWSFFTNDAATTTFDGKTLNTFTWQTVEGRDGDTDYDPKVLIHEIGHLLGLPDLYDYEPGTDLEGGVGGFDMMDSNKGNFNAYFRWVLGWITPEIVGGGPISTRNLRASGDTSVNSNKAVAVFPTTSTDPFQEFFMVENRQRIGNDGGDSNLPSDGLAIWHVDGTLNASGTGFSFNNTDGAHKIVRLIEADGLDEIEAGGNLDAGDYYNSGERFSSDSTPASNDNAGNATEVFIGNISANGALMTADIGFEGASVLDLADRDIADHYISRTNINAGSGDLSVSGRVINNGDGTSGGFSVSLVISDDSIIDSSDTVLATKIYAPLDSGENVPLLFNNVTVPASQALGQYCVAWIIDTENTVIESDETNNTVLLNNGNVKLNVIGASDSIDLLDDEDSPQVINTFFFNTGEPINITNSILNDGQIASGAFTVTYVLSEDNVIDDGDYVIGAVNMPSIPAGDVEISNLSNAAIPAVLNSGDYYLGWIIDLAEHITETDELNNFVLYRTVGQLITISNPTPVIELRDAGESFHTWTTQSGTTSVYANELFSFGAAITNTGNTPSGTFQVSAQMFNNLFVEDAARAQIGTAITIPSILPGDTYTFSFDNVAIPFTGGSRVHYIRWFIDSGGSVPFIDELLPGVIPEQDETNNTIVFEGGAFTLDVLPINENVNVTDAGVSTHILGSGGRTIWSIGETMTFTADVLNDGVFTTDRTPSDIFANPFSVNFYLSEDDEITTSDILIETLNSVGPLTGGAIETMTASHTLTTQGTPAGEYYIGWILDITNIAGVSGERDETDNVVLFDNGNTTITITNAGTNTDLEDAGEFLQNLSSNNIVAGSNYTLSHRVFNNGPDAASGFDVSYFLSSDSDIGFDDILIHTESVSGVPGNGTTAVNLSLTMPTGIPSGTYTLGWIIDTTNSVLETVETNNEEIYFFGAPVTVTNPSSNFADLADSGRVDHFVSSNITGAGTTFSVSNIVTNLASDPALPSTISYYFSLDDTLDANDFFLGSDNVPVLFSNASASVGLTNVLIPFDLAAGQYYLIWHIDSGNAVLETDELNNIALYEDGNQLIGVDVDIPDIDLRDAGTSNHLLSDDSVAPGDIVNISAQITNGGTVDSGTFNVNLYITPDTLTNVVDANDVLLGTQTISILAGDTIPLTFNNITIPADTGWGDYYLGWRIDEVDTIVETNESNNVVVFNNAFSRISVNSGICVEQTGTGFDVSFNSASTPPATGIVSPRTYTLYTDTDLDTDTDLWTVAVPDASGNTVIPGTGGTITIPVSNTAFPPLNGKRFFIVREN